MLREGTARRSESPWSSALHLVPKKDNGRPPVWRLQSSKRTTIQDRYPIRHIHEYSHQIAGCTIYHWPRAGLSSDSGTAGRRAENGHHYTFWIVQIPVHVLRPAQRRENIREVRGWSPEWVRLLLRVHRWYAGVLTHTEGVRATNPDPLQATTGLRDPVQSRQMCFLYVIIDTAVRIFWCSKYWWDMVL